MKLSNKETDLLERLIVSVGHVSDSIELLADKVSNVALEIDQSNAYSEIKEMVNELSSIGASLSAIDKFLTVGSEQTGTIAEKLSDIDESLDHLAATQPDKEV